MITPDEVELVNGVPWDTLGKLEAEVSAGFIVRLCRAKGGWLPFTKAELDAMNSKGTFHWNGLLGMELVIYRGYGTFEVTEEFITRMAGK